VRRYFQVPLPKGQEIPTHADGCTGAGAKAGDSPRKLFDVRGLYLRVMPSGGKYWRFNYRFKGKHKTLALGVYPDVSVARARQ
jgi:hypothetical protein